MEKKSEKHEAIRHTIHVDCPVEEAFRLFTEGFGEWWPLVSYSEAGKDAKTCEIEPWRGGRVLERTRAGDEREWGSVISWDPPRGVEFTWNPGGPRDERQAVEVEFQVEADGTKVTLTHRGWELAGVTVCVSGTALPGGITGVRRGTAVSVAPGQWQALVATRNGGSRFWSSEPRPTWAEYFLQRFAAFVAERTAVAV